MNAIIRRATPAAGQEGAGKDEERDRHDAEIVEAGEQFQADALDRHLASS